MALAAEATPRLAGQSAVPVVRLDVQSRVPPLPVYPLRCGCGLRIFSREMQEKHRGGHGPWPGCPLPTVPDGWVLCGGCDTPIPLPPGRRDYAGILRPIPIDKRRGLLCEGCTSLMRTEGVLTVGELRATLRRVEARARARAGEDREGHRPWTPFPPSLVPKILEAARAVVQREPSGFPGRAVYNEAPAVVATLLYLAGSPQFYGLTVDQAQAALAAKHVELRPNGEVLRVPVHDRLLDVWRRHLDARDFGGPQLFRNGQDPFEGRRAEKHNARMVRVVLEGRRDSPGTDHVRRRLRELARVDEVLSPIRFRKTFAAATAKAGMRTWRGHGGVCGALSWFPLHPENARPIATSRTVEEVVAAQREISAIELVGSPS